MDTVPDGVESAGGHRLATKPLKYRFLQRIFRLRMVMLVRLGLTIG